MSKLNDFVKLLEGEFDNSEQFESMKENGRDDFPFAEHINTVCNNKIKNLPNDFEGIFILEESYYTTKGNKHSSPHLFLFVEEDDKIKLISYEIPQEYNKNTLNYNELKGIDYNKLIKSEKFTPAIYSLKNGIWEGGSTSMFSPVLKFKLFEKFSEDMLEVSESMEMNGKRTFGYDEPIIYKRK